MTGALARNAAGRHGLGGRSCAVAVIGRHWLGRLRRPACDFRLGRPGPRMMATTWADEVAMIAAAASVILTSRRRALNSATIAHSTTDSVVTLRSARSAADPHAAPARYPRRAYSARCLRCRSAGDVPMKGARTVRLAISADPDRTTTRSANCCSGLARRWPNPTWTCCRSRPASCPPGAKAGDLASVSSLLVVLAASGGVLTRLVGLLQGWLLRNRGRGLVVEVAGDRRSGMSAVLLMPSPRCVPCGARGHRDRQPVSACAGRPTRSW